jgi:hypothetical protein
MIAFQLTVIFTENGIIDGRTTSANTATRSFVPVFRLLGNQRVSVFDNGFNVFPIYLNFRVVFLIF